MNLALDEVLNPGTNSDALIKLLSLQIKKLACIPQEQFEEALQHLEIAHEADQSGRTWIILGKKQPDGAWLQRGVKYQQLEDKLLNFMDIRDIYLTINSFNSPKRTLESLLLLNGAYVDLDYYKIPEFAHLTAEEFRALLQTEVFDKYNLPMETFTMHSGRGILLEWVFSNAVPATPKSVGLWTALQRYLHKLFEAYGADPNAMDASHVFRLVGTKNSKSNQLAKMLSVSGNKLPLSYFQEYVLPPLPERKVRKTKAQNAQSEPKKEAKFKRLFTLYSLHWARLMDLVELQQIRARAGILGDGMREFMCFLYRYWACLYHQDKELALENTLNFNKGFLDPISDDEVITQTRRAEKAWEEYQQNFDEDGKWLPREGKGYKGYNYRTETLITKLKITPEEQRQLKTLISPEIKQERQNDTRKKSRRNEEGLTAREQAKQEKIKAVKELTAQGLRRKEVAEELGLSARQVIRLLQE